MTGGGIAVAGLFEGKPMSVQPNFNVLSATAVCLLQNSSDPNDLAFLEMIGFAVTAWRNGCASASRDKVRAAISGDMVKRSRLEPSDN